MSRSRRKTPIMGITCARSDRPFKASEHRRERSAVRRALATADDAAMPHGKAFGDPWKAPKDGKAWMPLYIDHSRWLRK